MKQELLKGLSEEQIVKIKACKSQEEMLALAKQEGVELNEEQLEAVSGGACISKDAVCPKCYCNSCSHVGSEKLSDGSTKNVYVCAFCGHRFYFD